MTHTHLRPRNVNLCWQLDLFWVRGDDKWSSYAVVCLKWASLCRTHWLLTCGHRLSLACSDGEYKSYIKPATLLLLSGAGAWVARNFRVFVTEVGEICWKARDTRSIVITKPKLGHLRCSEVEVVIGLGLTIFWKSVLACSTQSKLIHSCWARSRFYFSSLTWLVQHP